MRTKNLRRKKMKRKMRTPMKHTKKKMKTEKTIKKRR